MEITEPARKQRYDGFLVGWQIKKRIIITNTRINMQKAIREESTKV